MKVDVSDPFVFLPPKARAYLERDAPLIDGWFHKISQWMFCILVTAQMEMAETSALAEIGLFEGKSFLLLNKLRADDEILLGYDLEIRDAFRHNSTEFVDDRSVIVRECDSCTLTVNDLFLAGGGPIRFFHVDGGHTKSVVKSDLRLAIAASSRAGIVVLDDFFSATLPGVTEGLFELAHEDELRGFVPFALGGNKCYLAQSDVSDAYRDVLRERMPLKPIVAETELQDMLAGRVIVYDY
jgi:hypothetical protein